MGQQGFWDWEDRQVKLEEQQDFLIRLQRLIPWENFRPQLQTIHHKPHKSNSGRKPIDVILMFKILVLQRYFNISDTQVEYQINDRISFMKFLGLGIEDRVPDATTIWLFREQLVKAGIMKELFLIFDEYLRKKGYQAKSGQMMDASFVPVPKQHNTKGENKEIKEGNTPKEWEEQPQKLSQKDLDARWTKKNGQSYYGYKDHISIDAEHGFIRCYEVTDASVHDSQVIGKLLDIENESDEIWADSAYRSEAEEKVLELMGFKSNIHERGYRNRPLTENQKEQNRERSRIRAKVEHNFGSWVNEMGGKLIEVIGQARVEVVVGLRNLAYNFKRYLYWLKQETI
jgi:IS5 family transposase